MSRRITGIRGAVLAAAPIVFAVLALSGPYRSLGPALARQLTGSASALLVGLPFFLLAVISPPTAVALSRAPPRGVMLCSIVGVLVVEGGGLISSARDYAIFLIVLAFVALVGLLVTTRSHYQRKGLARSPDEEPSRSAQKATCKGVRRVYGDRTSGHQLSTN